MPQSTRNKSQPATINGTAFLTKVVVPILKARLPVQEGETGEDGMPPGITLSRRDDGSVILHAPWNMTQMLAIAFRRRDEQRATLSFHVHAGLFLDNSAAAVLQLGPLLEPGPFNIRFGPELFSSSSLIIGTRIHIHPNDTDLVAERTRQLLQLAYDLDWLASLYLPERLGLGQRAIIQCAFGDDCLEADDLPERLEQRIRNQEDKTDTGALLFLAIGLGQWKDVLRIIARKSRLTGEQEPAFASLGARAWQELGHWERALSMSHQANIEKGRFPGAPWLSPCYLRSLIESGQDIEALKLLGKPATGEPGFYKIMRGRALHAAGDPTGARKAFDSYLEDWPGDIEARSTAYRLFENQD